MNQKPKCIPLKTALEIEISLKNYAAKQWFIKDVYNIYANTVHAFDENIFSGLLFFAPNREMCTTYMQSNANT